MTSRSSTRKRTTAASGPGVCWPVSSKFWYSTGSRRFDQSVRISTHDRAGNAPVTSLPAPDEVDRQQEVGVRRGFARAVEHAGGADQLLHRDRVGRVVRQVAPGDPVDRRVEMRAGVLAAGEVVPVPGRAALVVARHLVDAERPRLPEFRRQHDLRKLGRQRLRQVDDADAAAREFRGQSRQRARCHVRDVLAAANQ